MITDDYKEKKTKADKKRKEMDDDFETVINVVLGPVDQTINITLHKTLATLQHLTAEDRFDSRPSARRSRYRSDELHKGCPRTDGQAYRPEHRPAHAEDLPPGVQPNSEYAGEDSAERPRRDERCVGTSILTSTEGQYVRIGPKPVSEGVAHRRNGEIKDPKGAAIYNSLLLPENVLKSYDEIYKALRVIGEDCAKDAIYISRVIANGTLTKAAEDPERRQSTA